MPLLLEEDTWCRSQFLMLILKINNLNYKNVIFIRDG